MRSGIYLGPPRSRRAIWAWLLVAAVALATGVHALGVWQAEERARELAAELERREGSAGDAAAASDVRTREQESAVLKGLRALDGSGATRALPPTEVIRLVELALPDKAALVSLHLSASPEPSLVLEAVAETSREVTELEDALARSPAVLGTALLEERLSQDGTRSVRLQIDLVAGGPR